LAASRLGSTSRACRREWRETLAGGGGTDAPASQPPRTPAQSRWCCCPAGTLRTQRGPCTARRIMRARGASYGKPQRMPRPRGPWDQSTRRCRPTGGLKLAAKASSSGSSSSSSAARRRPGAAEDRRSSQRSPWRAVHAYTSGDPLPEACTPDERCTRPGS
jgi:hypothetical protein